MGLQGSPEMRDIFIELSTRREKTSPPGLAPRLPRALPQIPTSSVDLARYRASARPVARSTIRVPQVRTNLSSASGP